MQAAPRYSVILGNLGNTRDRFCAGYKDNPSSIDMLARAAKIPHVSGIELVGTWDVRPDNWQEMKSRLADLNVRCASIIPDLFTEKRYGKGSYSSPDAATRQHATDYTLQLCDIAGQMGCELLNLWPGQDGYDYLLCADYEQQRDWFRDAVRTVATRHPKLKFALEYKPKEPRCFSTIARMADTLLMCQETGCANVGVCIDTGHAFVAQESVGEAIVLAKRAGDRLFHMHFNDNHGAWDDDMIAGTVHSTCYIEMLYWLDRTGYSGWLSMDQYPYREDAAGAIGESIEWLRTYGQIAATHKDRIGSLLQKQDAVETSRFLRSVMFAG
jgi:sugar phosphate isomerase/epimerase